jgi:hypothetical protein
MNSRFTPVMALKEGAGDALRLYWAIVTAPFRVVFSFVAHRGGKTHLAH